MIMIAAIIFPIVISKYPAARQPLGAISIIIFLSEILIFERIEFAKRKVAAKIQELFDTEVLGINWNEFVAGSIPDLEIVGKYQKYITDEDKEHLRDWYPSSLSKLPLNSARLLCQRANIWWDSSLRKAFSNLLIGVCIILILILLVLNRNDSLTNAALNIVPFLPLFRVLYVQIVAQRLSATLVDDLKNKLDELINKLAKKTIQDKDISEHDIRSIQDEIYRHRSTNQPIPNWFYYLFRDSYESSMKFNADELVDKILS